MKKGRIWIVCGLCLVAGLLFWVCLSKGPGNPDLARYERWKRLPNLYMRAAWWNKKLPQGMTQLFRLSSLPDRYISEYGKLEVELVTSGYLTNVVLEAAPTNSVQTRAAMARIGKACPRAGLRGWNVSIRPQGVIITCRPQDELLCRKAFQN